MARRARSSGLIALVFAAASCTRWAAPKGFVQLPSGGRHVSDGGAAAAVTVAGMHLGLLDLPGCVRASNLVDFATSQGALDTTENPLQAAAQTVGLWVNGPTGSVTDYVIAFFIVVFLLMNVRPPTGSFVPFASPGTKFLTSIRGDESVMMSKAHGTSPRPPMEHLRWGVDWKVADKICCFNREMAERSGYWLDFLPALESDLAVSVNDPSIRLHMRGKLTFYDTVTGKPLFVAPRGRSFDEFLEESKRHGWPSFRDEEVETQHVRVLDDGETVSVDGTHLGHNLPDSRGNRYCINLVSVAGSVVPS